MTNLLPISISVQHERWRLMATQWMTPSVFLGLQWFTHMAISCQKLCVLFGCRRQILYARELSRSANLELMKGVMGRGAMRPLQPLPIERSAASKYYRHGALVIVSSLEQILSSCSTQRLNTQDASAAFIEVRLRWLQGRFPLEYWAFGQGLNVCFSKF